MHSILKTRTQGWLGALIAATLAAGNTGAAPHKKHQDKQVACLQSCNGGIEQKMRSCMESCPKPGQGKMEEFQACSQRCTESLNTNACYNRCEREGQKHRPGP
ncbi:hypothetical protein [Hyalangium versicolor]|uniref:hypothetical protein n=1 Tax=Hyalangium versicolor TaxID=2861190 RepID=UPI001CC95975|nr:hypothetical protein [Hyalangium versicolor]